ncbi:MAG: trehalose-6-phosphate synthase [Actinobacteria bacterium]|nr:MAG: trehalose-6-phosphate synthase [Actinomycetota bacterium]
MVPSRMPQPELIIVSNRGPLSFAHDDSGALVPTRGGGGLVTSLGPAVAEVGGTWIASAITDADREAAAQGVVEAQGFRLRSLVVEPDAYRLFYDVVANATLWFLHHNLMDLARRPRIDRRWREAWEGYRAVNAAFAEAVVEEAGDSATVLVHDYHLSLLGAALAEKRPDLATAHFHHTPFVEPTGLRVLPDDVATELLDGLAGHRACGFHSARWAAGFEASARSVLDRVPPTFVAPARSVLDRVPPTFVAPATIDADEVTRAKESPEAAQRLAALDAAVGDRMVIARVDRIELSKNILRGFHAYDELLATRPEWRERVVFVARVYPSREGLAEYLAYRQEVEALVDVINDRWGRPGWAPILLDTADDFPGSLAVLRRYDVLLVNPVRDGRDGVLVLSSEAGSWAELGPFAVRINPFDVSGTAEALDEALSMDRAARAGQAAALRQAVCRRTPRDWLDEQVRAAHTAPPAR